MRCTAFEEDTHDVVVVHLTECLQKTLEHEGLTTFNFPDAEICAGVIEAVIHTKREHESLIPLSQCRWFWIHGGYVTESILSSGIAHKLNIVESSVYPLLDILNQVIHDCQKHQEPPLSLIIMEIGTFSDIGLGYQFEPHF